MLNPPFKVGDWAYVPPGSSSVGLPARLGRVVEVNEAHGGVLVKPVGLPTDGIPYGWSFREVTPVRWRDVPKLWLIGWFNTILRRWGRR